MTDPSFKSLEAPSRNRRVTVPGVVGVHLNVVGLPAVRLNPSGTLKGLGSEAVRAMATKPASARMWRYILRRRREYLRTQESDADIRFG